MGTVTEACEECTPVRKNRRDQRHRNAYKRFWRNMRNYQRTVDEMGRLDARAVRQLNNALDAFNRMELRS